MSDYDVDLAARMGDASEATANIDLPVPEYRIGQTIYWSGVKQSQVEAVCPDCAGTGKWQVTTVTAKFEVPCQRCAQYGGIPRTLRVTVFTPSTQSMVISSVTVMRDIAPGQYGRSASVEYGGAGSTRLDERKAIATLEAAEAESQRKAAEQQVEYDAKPEGIWSRNISQRDLTTALAMTAEEERKKAKRQYDKAISVITEMPEEWWFRYCDKKLSEEDWREVASSMLSDLGEKTPEEWGMPD